MLGLSIKNIQCVLLFTLSTSVGASDEEFLRWHEGEFRIGFESVELLKGERMGLLGGSYLIDVGDSNYLGLGVYGALTGQRGGFFTGGIEGGRHFLLSKSFSANAGLFVGGGGGGSAPQGGGLMLRPYLGLSWHLSFASIGLQLSEVRFPNGDITSQQLALSLSIPVENLFSTGWLHTDGFEWAKDLGSSNSHYNIVSQRYIPDSDTKNTAGANFDEAIILLGFEMEKTLSNNSFATFSAAGAGGGQSDGYAEVLAGLGWRYDLGLHLSSKFQLRIGEGGGGAIDTGGGLVSKLEVGMEWRPSNNSVLGIGVGRYEALDGNFAANIASINLGYRFAEPDRSSLKLASFSPRRWKITINQDSYLLDGHQGRKTDTTETGDVRLITAQVDAMLNKSLLVSGSASFAYDGGAGGYAVSLIGLGWLIPISSFETVWLRADAQMGVAGGGGLNVGGGLLWQSKISLSWDLDKAISLQLGWGRVNAPTGTLNAEMVTLGISVRTTSLHSK